MTRDDILVRIRLENAQRFQRDAVASAAAVRGLSTAVETAGKRTAFTRAETFLWRQGVYTLRRELFHATVAVGAFAALSLKLGYDFNEARDRGVIAFTGILGGARAARREMTSLVGLTHDTGFQLPQLTQAATRMLEFGFTVKETNTQLRAFGTFAGRRNLGIEGVNALTGIFARIRTSGLLTMKTMQALIRLGVNVPAILRTQLGLSDAQTKAIAKGQLNVPASLALPALTKGLQATPGSEGLRGLFGIARSWTAELSAVLEKPLFDWATRVGPRVNAVLARAVTGFKSGGLRGMWLGIDPSGGLLKHWETLTGLVSGAWQVLRIWLDGVRTFGLPILGLLGGALAFLARHTTFLKLILVPLTAAYVAHRTILLAVKAATWLYVGAMKAGWLAMKLFYAGERLVAAGMWLLNLALAANPIVAIAIGATAAAVAFGILYWKVKAFRDFINQWGPYILLVFGPIGQIAAGTILIATHLGTIYDWVQRIGRALSKPFDLIINVIRHIPNPIAGVSGDIGKRLIAPPRAFGGPVLAGMPYTVGERGRELFVPQMPGRIEPLSSGSSALERLINVMVYPQKVTVQVAGRDVAEVNADYVATVGARQ